MLEYLGFLTAKRYTTTVISTKLLLGWTQINFSIFVADIERIIPLPHYQSTLHTNLLIRDRKRWHEDRGQEETTLPSSPSSDSCC